MGAPERQRSELWPGRGPERPAPATSSRRPSRKMRSVMIDADHFPLDMSSWREVRPGGRNCLFFAADRLAHVISPPPAASRPKMMRSAGVAELVDALDLGSSDESCGGSRPP